MPTRFQRPTPGTLAHSRYRTRLKRRAITFLAATALLYLITSHGNVALITAPLFALLVTAQVDQWFLTRTDQRVPLTRMLALASLAFPVIPVLVALVLHVAVPAGVGMAQMFVTAWTCWGLLIGRAAAQSRLGDQMASATKETAAAVLSLAGIAASFGFIADATTPITTTVNALDVSCTGVMSATAAAVLEVKVDRGPSQEAVLQNGLFTYEVPPYYGEARFTVSFPDATKPWTNGVRVTGKGRVTEVVTRIVSLGQLGTKSENTFKVESKNPNCG